MDSGVASSRDGATAFDIQSSMKAVYRQFDEIRGKSKAEIPFRFWDAVVLTAADANQQSVYESQLTEKLERKEIPSGLPYLVFHDPPGAKIGCGGATMYVVRRLTEIFGDDLREMLVLIINAGGQSQRLPSASVLGKIFAVLPLGRPPWQMLELKLASYLPLLPRMAAGFFHAASDTIEVFDCGAEVTTDDWNFHRPGLTALAHPSPLQIGATHGVFVLENGRKTSGKPAEFVSCVRVLQKPTVDEMQEVGAVLVDSDAQEEFVYTDSCFFFDFGMARKLLEFYNEVCPLQCEIDSYGDFMRSLGPYATDSFADDFRNVSVVDPSLAETRRKLFRKLCGTPLNVVGFNASKFFHLGTIRECLENFLYSGELGSCVGFRRWTFSVSLNKDKSVDNDGCVINSIVNASCRIGRRSVIEYCELECPVVVGSDCFISNCAFRANDHGGVREIPPGLFLHTIELGDLFPERSGYVTLAFHVNDDVKRKASGPYERVLASVTFLGRPLRKVVAKDTAACHFALDSHDDKPVYCLWYAKIFPVASGKVSSVLGTLDLVDSILNEVGEVTEEEGGKNNASVPRISAYEATQMACHKRMMASKRRLSDKIENLIRSDIVEVLTDD